MVCGKIAASAFASALLFTSSLTWAQGVPETPEAGAAIDEIIVTAQKRSQKLSDVPITVNAASAEQLAAAGVVDVTQLAKVAPSFAVGTSFSGVQVFSLRGINFTTTQISASPSVSTYIDEASLPYSVMANWMLLDVERIEVLKGPQGTLFGQNATGGSVNVIAAKPTSKPSSGIRSEVNNFGQVFLEGFVSGPLSNTLNARVAASTTQFGQWQRGFYLSDRKNGDQNKASLRLLLDWTPTDRLKVSVNLNANYDKSELQQYQFGQLSINNPALNPFPGLLGYPAPRDNRDADITPGVNTRRDDRLYQGVLRADYEVADDVTLTSLTNYADFAMNHHRDGDAVVYNQLTYSPNGTVKTFSQEFRLTGRTADKRLNYIIGANYENDKILDSNDVQNIASSQIAGLAFLNPVNPTLNLTTPLRPTSRSAAVFGNVDFEVATGLTLTGGARYTATKATQQGCTRGEGIGPGLFGAIIAGTLRAGAGLPPLPAINAYSTAGPNDCLTINNLPATPGGVPDYLPTSVNSSQTEHNVSWRAGVNYKPNRDALFYGLVSRGYKAGVFPGAVAIFFPTDITYVKQEGITSYEIGTKLSLLDRALNLNVSAFYYDYKDKQFQTYIPIPVLGFNSTITNVPKSSVKGIDIDVTVRPTTGLTLRGAVTYIDTSVDGDFVAKYTGLAGLVTKNVKGSKFNFAPTLSATADVDYEHPLSGRASGYVGASMLYSSKTFNELGEDNLYLIPGYATFDARIGVNSDKGWSAGLFVRNLTNKFYFTSRFKTSEAFAVFAGAPRIFGANASYKF